MVVKKKAWIKTADFEAKSRALVKDIEETNHITKTGILRLLEGFIKGMVEDEEPRFEIIKELRV